MWFKKRRQKRAEKNCILSWDLTAASSKKTKSSFFDQNASVEQSLYDPAKILNSISKERSQDPKSIYLRDNDQKNTLICFQKFAHNEILSRASVDYPTKVHTGLHLNHTLAFCTYLMFSV